MCLIKKTLSIGWELTAAFISEKKTNLWRCNFCLLFFIGKINPNISLKNYLTVYRVKICRQLGIVLDSSFKTCRYATILNWVFSSFPNFSSYQYMMVERIKYAFLPSTLIKVLKSNLIKKNILTTQQPVV